MELISYEVDRPGWRFENMIILWYSCIAELQFPAMCSEMETPPQTSNIIVAGLNLSHMGCESGRKVCRNGVIMMENNRNSQILLLRRENL